MEYVIVMDVSGDIDPVIAKENDIRFIPMKYTVGEDERVCTGYESETELKEFYNGQRNGDLTKTTQITPFEYEQFFENIFSEGKSVLYLCLSGGLSSTYQSACMAKESLKDDYPECEFYPVDTLAATGGMGVLAERAIRNRQNNMSLQDNYLDLVGSVKNLKHWFMVDDLAYLKRGGRISAATAVVGAALNVKPILTINPEGKLDTVSKKRGHQAALGELARKFMDEHDIEGSDSVYVIHADSEDKAGLLYDRIKEEYPEKKIRIHSLSPIIGAHTGPGMVAVCFMGK